MWTFVFLILVNPIILGNQHLSSKLILNALKKGHKGILNLYKEEGFLQVGIKVLGDTILIEEGSQFKFGKIKLKGNQAFSDSFLLSFSKIENSQVFNEFKLTECIEIILEHYENSGYPFCKISINNFELMEHYVHFEFHISEGPLVQIDTIKINGNNFTKDYVILRELRIEPGDIFSEKVMREANQRIQKLEFIESCEIALNNNSRQDELLIQIKEGPVNWVNGVFGYGTPGFMGFFDLEVLNLFGTGRALGAKWQKRDTISVLFELRYKESWLFGKPVNLIGSVSHNKEATYVKNRAEVLFDMPISKLFRANIGCCSEWVSVMDEARSQNPGEWFGILGLDLDTRPILHNMYVGQTFRFAKVGVHYYAKSEFNFNGIEKLTLNFDNYIGPFFSSLNFGAIFKENIQAYDEIRLGGARTLRGYWEGEFSGAQIGWLNIELRKFIGSPRNMQGFIFPFYDFGYIDGTFAHSFGIGIAVRSPIGLVKVIYGLPRGVSLMERSSPLDGKIHFLISSKF